MRVRDKVQTRCSLKVKHNGAERRDRGSKDIKEEDSNVGGGLKARL